MTFKKTDWIYVKEQMPPTAKIVETKVDDGKWVRNIQKLVYDGNLWWLLDYSMYVQLKSVDVKTNNDSLEGSEPPDGFKIEPIETE